MKKVSVEKALSQADVLVMGHVKGSWLNINLGTRATIILLIVMALLTSATLTIQAANLNFGNQAWNLSLGNVAPPSDEPVFTIEATPNIRYLRGATGIVYDGTNWKLEEVEGQGDDLSVQFNGEGPTLRPIETSQTYSQYTRDRLMSASLLEGSAYAQLPDNITDRVKSLSLQITAGFATPFEKARAIEVFLRSNYTYGLGFAPAPPEWEPNDWFLFESKKGVCGNFTSAFVVLARASEIPSRLAAGYFVPAGQGKLAVFEDQAHAWAEVGFEELGWLAFDATYRDPFYRPAY